MRMRSVMAEDRAAILELLGRVRVFTEEEIACATELLDIYLAHPTPKD